jgi:cellulose synthase/poly-beta-1,6-N-acetylglucosamine synthase-like glycosyltransferase
MGMQIVFWATVAGIVYTYAGFPLLLLLRGALLRRDISPAPFTPRVSLIIVAHNEVATIGAKVANAFELDYPADRLEVIVASDGSTDGTAGVVRDQARPQLRLLDLPRGGKINALNAAAKHAAGDVFVFSDANSMYTPGALRALMAPFADTAVGAVAGNQCYVRDLSVQVGSLGERLYWSYDRLLKRMQHRAGSITSATGAIHAIRCDLFVSVPAGVNDDLFISTGAIVKGRRLAFAEDAVAWEEVAATDAAEFNRKIRIIARALRAVAMRRQLLNPLRYGFYSIQLLSHKVLRWSVCWLLLLLAVTSGFLYGHSPVYTALGQFQVMFYSAALFGLAVHRSKCARHTSFKVLGIPFYFCAANYAALRAWVRALGGGSIDVWEPGRSRVVESAG